MKEKLAGLKIEEQPDFKVVRVNANAMAALKWVMKATKPNDPNPRIRCVYISEREIAATNGFQFHMAIPQIDQPLPVGAWLVRGTHKDIVTLEPSPAQGMFDFQPVVELAKKVIKPVTVAEGYRAVINLSPELVRNAVGINLQKMTMYVNGGPIVFEGVIGEEILIKAYIMPMGPVELIAGGVR